MDEKAEVIEKRISLKWIRGESGTTYLCPVKSFNRLDNPSEKELQMICVDESDNPHND